MSPTHDEDSPGLAPGAAEVLQAATRVLAGVALRSLDVLDSAVTLPQFRLLAVLADLGPARPGGRPGRSALTRRPSPGWPTGWWPPGMWPAAPIRTTAAWSPLS